jgi:hypothetical protein
MTPYGLTLAEMNKYDMVFWLAGGYYVRYAMSSTTDRNLVTNYLAGGGKLILQGTYWYNYYSWAPSFYAQFGIRSYTRSYYMSSSNGYTMSGTGGLGDYDEYKLMRGHSEITGNYNYFSMAEPLGGTTEFEYKNYYANQKYMLVHKANALTGSIAMMWGFDLNQIDLKEDQVELMADVLKYFDIGSSLTIEINEGDTVEFQNIDIVDPAKDVDTELFHFEIDWGDAEVGPLTNVTDSGVINKVLKNTGPSLVVPNDHETKDGDSQNTIPLGPRFGVRRYQQFYDASQLGESRRDIDSIGFRYRGAFAISYSNMKMYLSHTTSNSLDRYFANNYGTDRTEVFSRTSFTYQKTTSTEDFEMISLDKAFSYDGTSNLVLEIVYSTGTYLYRYFDADYDDNLERLWGYSPTSTSGLYHDGYGLVTKFGFKNVVIPPSTLPWESYMHTYRDNPCNGDEYRGTIHVYDDDLGHGTLPFIVKVKNVVPEVDPIYVMPKLVTKESGYNNLVLPAVPFSDPGTQSEECRETWTYWWDMDNDGKVHNSPDELGPVPPKMVTEKDNMSYGYTPKLEVCVNDDFVLQPIALYLYRQQHGTCGKHRGLHTHGSKGQDVWP